MTVWAAGGQHTDEAIVGPPDPETLQTFIEDVAPQVRERVATARADAPSIG
jgi:alkanesulfonate monooxygenase SsuD/methylene tetrahydromethanopterin reductase-like flavin-dependent oxidoreductase (luciferase family)